MSRTELFRGAVRAGRLVFLLCPMVTVAPAQATIQTIAITGDAAPDGNGTFFIFGRAPVLNESGQLAFIAVLGGTSGGASDDTGIFVGSGAAVSQIVREGQAAPDANGTFSLPLGIFVVNSIIPGLNDAGQAAFYGELTGTSGGLSDDSGVFVGSGAAISQIAREGQSAPDANGTFRFVSTPALNNAGEAAFLGLLTGTSGGGSDDSGIFRGDDATLTQIVRAGQAAPDGNGAFDEFSFGPTFNDAGQAAFYGELIGTSGGTNDDIGLFRGDGGTISQIAREGQFAPANGKFSGFGFPALNNSGQMAFWAALTDTISGAIDNNGIYRSDGNVITQIAREARPVPDVNGVFDSFDPQPALNETGWAAFWASLRGTTGAVLDNSGIFLGDGFKIVQIARKGQSAPDGNGTFSILGGPALNNASQTAFMAELTGTSGGTADDRGIFLADNLEIVQVAREGERLAGSIITELQFLRGPDFGGRSSVNDVGQVAFGAVLADGRSGVFRFTPGVAWRIVEANTRFWGDHINWTLGIIPSSMSDVTIAPPTPVTVTGPDADTTVKSLTIGGGSGLATLELQPGAVLGLVDGTATIAPTGALVGQGTLNANVLNQGTINASGLMQFDGSLTNGIDGEVIVNPAEDCCSAVMDISGTVTNSGMIQLTSSVDQEATLSVTGGAITNNPGATIEVAAGAGGARTIDGQLINRGNFNVGAPLTVTGSLSLDANSLKLDETMTVGSYTQTAGDLFGPADLIVLGQLTWTGGDMYGGGTTSADGGMEISGSAFKSLTESRTLENNAAGTWSGTGDIFLQATFHNSNGATLDITGDGDIWASDGVFPDLENAGTLTKFAGSQDGVTSIRAVFTNSGTVTVRSGTLQLGLGSTNSGAFVVEAGAVLDFGRFDDELEPTSTVTGEGTVRFSGGGWSANIHGDYDVSMTELTNGDANFFGSATTAQASILSPVSDIGGTGTLTIGTLTWTNGGMGGGGTTIVNDVLEMSGPNPKSLYDRTLVNNGIVTWSQGGFTFGHGATFINNGTFDIAGDVTTGLIGGAAPQLNNTGSFLKSAGAGTTEIMAAVANSGNVEVQSGTLRFVGGYTQTAGDTLLSGGNMALLTQHTMQIEGGSLSGVGTVDAHVNSSGTVGPGLSTGVLTIDDDYEQQRVGVLAMEIGELAPGTDHDQLVVIGTATLAGTLDVIPLPDYTDPSDRGSFHTFELIMAGNVVGTFDEVTYDGDSVAPTIDPDDISSVRSHFGNGLFRILNYTDENVEWVNYSATPGDANADLIVDADDFEIWNNNNFTSGTDWTTGDFNGDGVTDVSDFNLWISNQGAIAVAASAVPEPNSVLWLFVAFVGTTVIRRRR